MSELLKALEELDIIYREPVVGASGRKLPFYVDFKKAYGWPRDMSRLAFGLYQKIRTLQPFMTCVAASGYGGVLLANRISGMSDMTACYIREEPKNHGRKNYIDGYVPKLEDRVIIVDDVKTTGSSIKKIISILSDIPVKPVGAAVLLDRSPEDKLDLPVLSLFKIDELGNLSLA